MLNLPYRKFASKENNNYYTLWAGDKLFIAIETVLPYWSGKKLKELVQGLKVFPVYSPVMLAFAEMTYLKKVETKEVEGLGKENIYETINIKAIREKIAELTDSVHEESVFDFNKVVRCATIKQMMEDNSLELLMKQKVDSIKSIYWLAKSDKFGKLTIQEIIASGRSEEKLQDLQTYLFDIEIIGKLLLEYNKQLIIKKRQELRAMKKEQKNKKGEK